MGMIERERAVCLLAVVLNKAIFARTHERGRVIALMRSLLDDVLVLRTVYACACLCALPLVQCRVCVPGSGVVAL